jgi:transcriptional regulator with XRE-family HTH domain
MKADDRFLKQFGVNVRAARKELGLSQTELAQKADVSIKMISGIERGVENSSLRLLFKVAKALGVSFVDLVQGL